MTPAATIAAATTSTPCSSQTDMSAADLVLDTLRRAPGRILLTGPTGPDGDSLGACLALRRWLLREGRAVDVVGVAAAAYRAIPDVEHLIPDGELVGDYASVVILDGDRHRLTPPANAAFERASWRALIDHHASSTAEGYDAAWLEPRTSSTCEMLYHALSARGGIDAAMAEQLYVGLIFDTGCFRYSTETPTAHRVAAALLEHPFDHAALTARVLTERSARMKKATK